MKIMVAEETKAWRKIKKQNIQSKQTKKPIIATSNLEHLKKTAKDTGE